MITISRNEDSQFVSSLTKFVNLVISGEIAATARPFFFGATLIGLNKKDGGVRPIAIGCTLRRLAAKCVSLMVRENMGELLFPLQLGYGTPLGAEAVVHAARSYLAGLESGYLMCKLDFSNAFNCVRRDKMLLAVLSKAPHVFPLAFAAYSRPSFLYYGSSTIFSSEGVQQGDPLGPLLFCIAIHDMVRSLRSEFRAFYLDDGILGGTLEDVKSDLLKIESAAKEINLSLNHSKSEIICVDVSSQSAMLSFTSSLISTPPENATLLGSPIGGSQSIVSCLNSKIDSLKILGGRLKQLHAHDALCLLCNAFSLPKVLYILRTAPCAESPLLQDFDDIQRSLLESICNIQISDIGWLQATLPIKAGGLGIRSLVSLAPSAFLASAAASSPTALAILPQRTSPDNSATCKALEVWRSATSADPPSGLNACRQKCWDSPIIQGQFASLLDGADLVSRARLLASQQKEAGAWLNAPPITSLGLRMDNECIRVAVGLRLGSSLCQPHRCSLCGEQVSNLGLHGLSCRRSPGRIARHAALNDLVKRALAAADVPAQLEPHGLSRSDGKRPDGVTIIPWRNGRSLVWDVTCRDSFAPTYLHLSSSRAGSVADQAAMDKQRKYSDFARSYHFVPIAVESSGAFGKDALEFFQDLGRRTKSQTKDVLSYHKLCQRISVTIQRFNTVSILGCLGKA